MVRGHLVRSENFRTEVSFLGKLQFMCPIDFYASNQTFMRPISFVKIKGVKDIFLIRASPFIVIYCLSGVFIESVQR